MRLIAPSMLLVAFLASGCGPERPARAKPRAEPSRMAARTEEPRREEPRREEAAVPETSRSEPRPAAPAAEESRPRWKVVSVHDGDTLRCLDADNVQHKVRLHGIDAPEIGQAFGTKSREQLASLAMGRTTLVDHRGEDRYGRTLARLEVDGRDVNRDMVAAGMAWHYTRYDDDPLLAAAEREARAERRGLWADAQAMPPWEWRAGEREREQARRKPSRR